VLHAHIYDPPPPISTLRPDLPARVNEALNVMLAKQPDQRFASAAAFLTALGGRSGPTAKPPLEQTHLYPGSPTVAVQKPSPTPARWRTPLVLGGVLGVVLLVAAYALFNRLTPGPTPEATPQPSVATVAVVSTTVPELTPAPAVTASSTSPSVAPSTTDAASACSADIARINPLWGSDWSGVIGILEASRVRDPGCPEIPDKLYSAYLSQAAGLLATDQHDLALVNLDKAVQLVPGRGEAAVQRRALQQYRDGTTAKKNGDLDQAIARLDELVQTDREYAGGRALSTLYDAELERAQRYADANRLPEALKQAQDATLLKPSDTRARTLADALSRRSSALAPVPSAGAVPATPRPSISPGQPPIAPTDIARLHYQAINDRRYDNGYALLSARLQKQSSRSDYQSWFVNKASIKAENSTLVSEDQGRALVEAVADSTDRVNGQLVRRRFVERFALLLENGAWRIDEVNAISQDALGDQTVESPFWTVIVASEALRADADAGLRRLRASGGEGGVLFSSDYGSLNPNYWVVYSGRFTNKPAADQHSVDLKGQGFSVAYPREVRR
jgi:tetratricopeptide (TPR) repeat protein